VDEVCRISGEYEVDDGMVTFGSVNVTYEDGKTTIEAADGKQIVCERKSDG
jgi:hypothetical protein